MIEVLALTRELSKIPVFNPTALESPITEIALALAVKRGHCWHASGTAVTIANGLAITAKHVFQDYWAKYGNGSELRGSLVGDFGVVARQVLPGGRIALWNVTRAWLSPVTDIAFIRLNARSESAREYARFRVPPINPLAPAVGDRIAGFGYHSSVIDVEIEDDVLQARWNDQPATSVGEVVEVHQRQRDSIRLNFPCFRTNARFEGGMSGGPLINDRGEVCGLVCSSLVGDPAGGDMSYATTIWPSVATFVHYDLTGRPSEIPHRVLSLAQAGVFRILHLDRLDLVEEQGQAILQCRV